MSGTGQEKTELGEKLKELRKQHSYTQEELAQKLLVSRQTICNWEKGKVSPHKEMREKLCELYGISLTDLLDINETVYMDTTEEIAERPVEIWQDDEKLKKLLLACSIAIASLLTARIPLLGVFVCISGLVASQKWEIHFGWLNVILIACIVFSLYQSGLLIWNIITSWGKPTFRWTI